ncbi:polysaccharide biosynthesis/export family protein [Desulfovibrio sp. TomC]|uniref:polysaccharide biosynthesis/export family protein n=1 Tax=Desulfovibrio sp. TomC TaxID=1562888 RepID=UPI00057579DD|nr:polysaccharide biosynthesis/export family protein [Desulfovibrio sp. TomC]KHK00638.1 Polysaccharide export lipoprotein Wza [Desulfovibrio sp. TomC]
MPVCATMPSRILLVYLATAVCLCACARPTAPPPATATSKTRPEAQSAAVAARRATLGYGDELSIAVWRQDDLKATARVDEAGRIQLPLIGEVAAGGRTISELRADLTRSYAKYLVDPQVTVTAATIRSQTALVLGEVKTQGVVPVDHDIPLFEAVARAGGFSDNAGKSTVVLFRGLDSDAPKAYVLDMKLGTSLGKGTAGFDRYLEGGDVLYVPKSAWADFDEFLGHLNAVVNAFINTERLVIFLPQLRDAINDLSKGPVNTTTTVIQQSQPVAGEYLSNSQGGVISVQ